MSWTEHHYANGDELVHACAMRLVDALGQALANVSRATMALAGGRTAPPILLRLCEQSIPWDRVTVVPTDERWVSYEHADCNLRQLRESFAAPGLSSLPLVPETPGIIPDADFACAQLASLPEPFSAVMLGMGADGHFASLFPGAPTLSAALDPSAERDAFEIIPEPIPSAGPHPRITLSLMRLLRTRRLMLVISGEDKLKTLRTAQTNATAFPIGALLHAPQANVDIFWSP